jgi:hypothetical protein
LLLRVCERLSDLGVRPLQCRRGLDCGLPNFAFGSGTDRFVPDSLDHVARPFGLGRCCVVSGLLSCECLRQFAEHRFYRVILLLKRLVRECVTIVNCCVRFLGILNCLV